MCSCPQRQQRSVEELKAATLADFIEYVEAQPFDAINMHTGNYPNGAWDGWSKAIRALPEFSDEVVRALSELPEVWAYEDRRLPPLGD